LEYCKFKVYGQKGKSGCSELEEISHVAHIKNAVSILKSNQIKTSLVYDHSILNKDRILVCWLSPNVWNGYRYGSVRFRFKTEEILKQFKYVYWVEKIDKYNPTACRILFTNNDYSAFGKLVPYDIVEKNGPIWFDFITNKFYWNSSITLELMFEDSIKLNNCKIDFVNHHHLYCNLSNQSCREKKVSIAEVKALFLANVISSRVDLVGYDFKFPKKNDFINDGKKRILDQFSNEQCKGSLIFGDVSSYALAFSIIVSYAKGYKKMATELLRLFNSKDDLRKCIDSLVDSICFKTEKVNSTNGKIQFKALPIFTKQDSITFGIFIGINRKTYQSSYYEKYIIVDKFENLQQLNNLIEYCENGNMYLIREVTNDKSELINSIKNSNKHKLLN